MNRYLSAFTVAVIAVSLAGCGDTPQTDTPSDKLRIVATSPIVADVVSQSVGGVAEVSSVIPNGFDSHTYEPRPSELQMLADADLIVIADASLNSGLTQLAQLSGDRERILDLNKESLSERDFLYREGSSSWNPHTWTDPRMVEKWIPLIVERVSAVSPETREEVKARSESYATRIRALDEKIEKAFANLKPERRKLVVYHDAWEYFGRRYGLKVIGALQAVSFAEPSSAEIARMAEQVRRERVPAFFGSEVFPSDVLKALEAASGARYIPDLADDRLLGNVGDLEYGYIQLMESNLTLLLNGLAG